MITAVLAAAVLASGCQKGGGEREASEAVSGAAAGDSGEESSAADAPGEEGTEAAAEPSGDEGQGAGSLAGAEETAGQIQLEEGLEPVFASSLRDGVYQIQVDSSSPMFRITECELTVQGGEMEAAMTMGGMGYLKLYMGSGEEALKGDETEFIPYEENEQGEHVFTVPVEALDWKIPCSAFSRKKEKWYDRELLFRSDSLPPEAWSGRETVTAESLGLADGSYTVEVELKGGSGRASVESPAVLCVEDGKAFAVIVWGSGNYDYMKVGEEQIDWDGEGEFSTFRIPVEAFDRNLSVIADTVAMSTPHEIAYTLTFDSSTIRQAGQEE